MTEKPGAFKLPPALWAGIIGGGAALASVLVMALYANISARKAEAREISFKVVDLDERSIDPAPWANNFPLQFDTYQRTTKLTFTNHGEAAPNHNPMSNLDKDPNLLLIFT